MTPNNSKVILLDVLDQCRTQLPPRLAQNLTTGRSDPAPFRKGLTDICRLRVFPLKKAPLQFWSSSWCFYELGLGVYDGALNVGAVMFVQFPFQKICGDSRYWKPTLAILEKLGSGRNAAFDLIPSSGRGTPTIYKRLYKNKDFPQFPADQAAKDLAWLIGKTLPAFETM